MVKGLIDGDVKDKVRAQEYLDAILPLMRPGAVVRVTPKSIKVDTSGVRGYNVVDAEKESVSEAEVLPST